MDIYLNGQMVDPSLARISVFDAGLQHGVGLFETMGAYHGRVFRLGAHLQRLQHSARELGLSRELDLDRLSGAVQETLRHNQLTEARVRLTVTAGPVGFPTTTQADSQRRDAGLTVLVVASEPTRYDPAYFERGVTVVVAHGSVNPFDPLAGHKTLSYWPRLRALRQAASARIAGGGSGGGGHAAEAVWLSTTNHLASGSVSNLFLVKGNQLFTPYAHGEEVHGALPAPVLPGVTRAAVIELAESMGTQVTRRMLTIEDLLEADEVFLTNSGWLLLPVVAVEKTTLGSGRVGPVTERLRLALLDGVDRETRATG